MNRKKEVAGYVMMEGLALVIALIINYLVILRVEIPTNSMENTIMAGSRVVVLRPAYLFSDPKRGDIVVFKYPDDETQNYAKRIIGLPGETIEIRDGLVYVNGFEEPLEEDYLKETPNGSYGPYEVPEDSYFMLGDNREVSEDSRFWENPYVRRDKIIGRIWFEYYPSIRFYQ